MMRMDSNNNDVITLDDDEEEQQVRSVRGSMPERVVKTESDSSLLTRFENIQVTPKAFSSCPFKIDERPEYNSERSVTNSIRSEEISVGRVAKISNRSPSESDIICISEEPPANKRTEICKSYSKKRPIKKKKKGSTKRLPSWYKEKNFKQIATEVRKKEKEEFSHKVAKRWSQLKGECQDPDIKKPLYDFVKSVFDSFTFPPQFRTQLLSMSDEKFILEVQKINIECDLDNLPSKDRETAKLLNIPAKRVFPMLTEESSDQFRPFSFAKFTNEKNELCISLVKSIAVDMAKFPLGCTFDGEHFIFTGGDKIFVCEEDGEHVQVLLDKLHSPSAVTVVHPKESFAFVEDNYIGICFKTDGTSCIVANGISKNARGLAFMKCGTLVTCQRKDMAWFIVGYDITATNNVQFSFKYGGGLPSFMCSHDDVLFVTDLDKKCMSTFVVKVIPEQGPMIIPQRQCQLDTLPSNLRCVYPSGIACDSRREVIVADARKAGKGMLLWSDAFDAERQWKEVKVMGRNFPYASQFSISPRGFILVACRIRSRMMLYKFIQ